MSRGGKVFRPTDLPESNSSGYPAPFRDGQRKRWNRRLGDHGGLKNFGVNFVRVEPGGQSWRGTPIRNKTSSFTSWRVSSSSSPMRDADVAARRLYGVPGRHWQWSPLFE